MWSPEEQRQMEAAQAMAANAAIDRGIARAKADRDKAAKAVDPAKRAVEDLRALGLVAGKQINNRAKKRLMKLQAWAMPWFSPLHRRIIRRWPVTGDKLWLPPNVKAKAVKAT